MNNKKLDSILDGIAELKLKLATIEFSLKKEEFAQSKHEIQGVVRIVNRLESDIIIVRTDTIDNRLTYSELKKRITRLESHIGLTTSTN